MKVIKKLSIRFKNVYELISKKRNILSLALVLLIAIKISLPLFSVGFIPTHDGEYHILRLFEFDKMIKSGEWFPRWAEGFNSGYGIPLFNFVYPLPSYIGEIFHLIGFSFIDSFKLVLASGFILSGLTFYLLARYFFRPFPSLIGSIFYLLAPYHLVDVYIRGSVGEVWSLAIVPLAIWSGLAKKYYVFCLSLVLLILSHNILAVIFFPLVIFFIVFQYFTNDKNNFKKTILYSFLSIGISAFFWLPALFEKKYVIGLQQIDYRNHFVQFWQLLYPSWGTGFSGTGNLTNQMSFQIGIAHILVVIFLIFFLFRKKIPQQSSLLIVCLLSLLFLSVFLMLPASKILWELIPILSYFQFPWRLLSVAIFVISFLTALICQENKSLLIKLGLLSFGFLFYWPYTKPVIYQPRTDSYYLQNPVFTKGTNSPGNSFNTVWFRNYEEVNEKMNKTTDISINSANVLPLDYTYNLTATDRTKIVINTAYFPGWKVFVNGVEKEVTYKDDGLISFKIDPGTSLVKVKFMDTITRLLAKYISFFSFLILIITFLKSRNLYESRR